MAGDDGESAFCVVQGRVGAIGDVESQMCFAVTGVGTVAFEAFVGEDRTDIKVIADFSIVVLLAVKAGGKDTDARCEQG